jgi:DNA-binding NarL/FixJ family response regulator
VVERHGKRGDRQALSISAQTVKRRISSILAKLDVPNRTLAALAAISRRLV